MHVGNHVCILDAVRYIPFTEARVTRVFQTKFPVLLFNVSIYFLELDEPFQLQKIEGLRPMCTIGSFCLTN